MLNLDEKQLKSLHTKVSLISLQKVIVNFQSNLKKFMENVQTKNSEKVEKMCSQGMDANFHDSQVGIQFESLSYCLDTF